MDYQPVACATCGSPLEHLTRGQICARCAIATTPDPLSPVVPVQAISYADAAGEKSTEWGIWSGLLVWVASIAFMLVLQLIALIGYGLAFDRGLLQDLMKGRITPVAVLVSLVATFGAQILTMVLAWVIVTEAGKKPFLKALGWDWHPQFRMIHAIALSLGMLGLGWLAGEVLPHKETDLDKLLNMGLSVRLTVAVIATLGAPIVEEVVYRGVLFSAFERKTSSVLAIVVVTVLFWIVHVPQYWGSWAVLVSLLALSLALTLVRALTGKLLPCVVTHFLFNGIQAVGIVFFNGEKAATDSAATALHYLLPW